MLTSKSFVKILTTNTISLFLLGSTFLLVSINKVLATPKTDFNNDGKSDILWRNTSTGDNAIWFMNGGTVSSSSAITSQTSQNWKVVGTGDFNNDGKSDILWRNTSTGSNSIWFMNGGTVSSSSAITSQTNQNWKIVGTGQN
jgi:hypothetical protein